jgi:hypothetical protein
LARSAWGSEVTVAASSSVTRSTASPSCTRPEIRTPPAFIAVTTRISAPVVSRVVRSPPPTAAETYAPAMNPAAGAPTGTAK